MSIVVSAEPRIRDVEVSDDLITARLTDGRTISVPLSWSWRLSEATAGAASEIRDPREAGRASDGPKSMKISVWTGCWLGLRPDARRKFRQRQCRDWRAVMAP